MRFFSYYLFGPIGLKLFEEIFLSVSKIQWATPGPWATITYICCIVVRITAQLSVCINSVELGV